MNERIKELAEQAEKYADANFKGALTFETHYDAVAQIKHLFGIKHNGVEE